MGVHLHDLLAVPLAGVGDGDGQAHGIGRRPRPHGQVAVLERRVRQAVTEAEQRAGRLVDVVAVELAATAAGVVARAHPGLAGRAQQGHGESPGRRHAPRQDVGEGGAASSPGGQATTTADAARAASPRAWARPETTTTTVGVPVAATASIRRHWSPGRARWAASRSSPRWPPG